MRSFALKRTILIVLFGVLMATSQSAGLCVSGGNVDLHSDMSALLLFNMICCLSLSLSQHSNFAVVYSQYRPGGFQSLRQSLEKDDHDYVIDPIDTQQLC